MEWTHAVMEMDRPRVTGLYSTYDCQYPDSKSRSRTDQERGRPTHPHRIKALSEYLRLTSTLERVGHLNVHTQNPIDEYLRSGFVHGLHMQPLPQILARR
jgi:hypothetical protein